MDEEIFIKRSALKRKNITEESIRHAFRNRRFDHPFPGVPERNLLIGPDQAGNLLEIMYNVLDGNAVNVFHAMKCRKEYLAFLS